MSIEALDSLLSGSDSETSQKAAVGLPSTSGFISVEEWAWAAFNEYFDNNQLGKKRHKLRWQEQTGAYLDTQKESK